MTEREFIYWLQGSLELGNIKTMDEKQVQVLKDHLALVMTKVTPPVQTVPFIQNPNITIPPYTITCSGYTGELVCTSETIEHCKRLVPPLNLEC